MAEENDNVEIIDENEEEVKGKKVAKHDSGAADLEKVTDYVEEVELSAQSMGEAMAMVHGRASEKAEAASVKAKELSKIKLKEDDILLIINEMEIPRTTAERTLREHRGNVVNALLELTN